MYSPHVDVLQVALSDFFLMILKAINKNNVSWTKLCLTQPSVKWGSKESPKTRLPVYNHNNGLYSYWYIYLP